MSLLRRAPRQVYEVHGEDDPLEERVVGGGEDTVHPTDTGVQGGGVGRALGLTLFAAVALGVAVLVLLHVSRAPAVRRPVAERRAPSDVRRRAFPNVPTTAPPQVHVPHIDRKAHAPTSRPVTPHRHHRRNANGHEDTPNTVTVAPVGGRTSATAVWAGSEFEF
ncbi:MAG: hypothetical protein ACRDJ3_07000, partial [Solirubrobacteraceae bacterium]